MELEGDTTMSTNDWWTRHEVAAYLQIKVGSVNSWVNRHRIKRTLSRDDHGRPMNLYSPKAVRKARERR